MFKILYICIVFACVACFFSAYKSNYYEMIESITEMSNDISTENADEFVSESTNWDKFISAVIWKESRGNETCVGDNGKAVGVLQIHPIMVREANRILKMKNIDKEYTYEDRYSRDKSIEIFNIVQDFHNAEHDFDRALQIWNKNHPESYKTQIMNKYNELISG